MMTSGVLLIADAGVTLVWQEPISAWTASRDGRFVSRVERTRIVPPTALWVKRRVRYDRLILTACHPLYRAAQRIVVFARFVRRAPPA